MKSGSAVDGAPTSHRGFTLLELLVVLGIIAVLATIAVPVYQRIVESGRATACLGNLRQIGAGLTLYLGENNLKMPTLRGGRASLTEDVPVIDNTLDRYIKDKRVFACPADQRGLAATTGTSYYWNVALNGQTLASLNFMKYIEDQSRIPILLDKEAFHPYVANKVNILYGDGHAASNSPAAILWRSTVHRYTGAAGGSRSSFKSAGASRFWSMSSQTPDA